MTVVYEWLAHELFAIWLYSIRNGTHFSYFNVEFMTLVERMNHAMLSSCKYEMQLQLL